MASEQTAARFKHLVQQRAAKADQVLRLLTEIDGLTVALDELLDGSEGKAAHADLITRLTTRR